MSAGGQFLSSFGALSALPFLLSLMAYASVHYVARVALGLAEREQSERQLTAVREATELQDAVTTMETRISWLRQDLAERMRAEREYERLQGELDTAQTDLENVRERLTALQEEVARGDVERAKLEELEGRAKDALRSKSELDEKFVALQAELEKLRTVLREMQQGELRVVTGVLGGRRRPSLFVECNGQGALIMPEGTRLE